MRRKTRENTPKREERGKIEGRRRESCKGENLDLVFETAISAVLAPRPTKKTSGCSVM